MVNIHGGIGDGSLLLWGDFDFETVGVGPDAERAEARRQEMNAADRVERRANDEYDFEVGVGLIDSWMVVELGSIGIKFVDLDDIVGTLDAIAIDEDFTITDWWVAAGKEVVTLP